MLTEDQKKQVITSVQKFGEKVSEYIQKKSELEGCERNIQMKMEELSKVTEEERQMEIAMEVLYGQSKKESVARKIEEEIRSWQQKSERMRNELTQLKTNLLEQMRNLPIPADLENSKKEDSNIVFLFFEGAELGKEGIDTICDLFRQQPPLNFGDVMILPESVVVRNALGKKEAISKFVEAIRSFRMHVDNLSKSYEQIDEMVERIKKSKQSSGVLRTLANGRTLSSKEIARILSMDERKVYNTCYNLTRSNWRPPPIQRTPSGEWKLTLPGEILVNRLLEKYPNERLESSSKASS